MTTFSTLIFFILFCNQWRKSFTTNVNNTKNADTFITQPLDHFTSPIRETWKQRYAVDRQYFNGSGPIFLVIGSEGAINSSYLSQTQMLNYATQFNALLVILEHRYYGESRPRPTLATANLAYLNTQQTLADLVAFHGFIVQIQNLTNKNKWIAFASSYGGTLAAWFRLKFPHLVHAAYASSAPLLAKTNFPEYLLVTKKSLESYSGNCTSEISKAIKQIQILMNTNTGRKTLEKGFNICEPIVSNDDVTAFYNKLTQIFKTAVQKNRYNSWFNNAKSSIKYVCDIMMDTTVPSPLHRYEKLNSVVLQNKNETCLVVSNVKLFENLRNTTYRPDYISFEERPWHWQTCNEFGFYQTTDLTEDIFGATIPLSYFINRCSAVYGIPFDYVSVNSSVNYTNAYYGGLDYQGTRVVFINGKLDPWHALSINTKPNSEIKVFFMNNTSHEEDFQSDSPTDSDELKQTRKEIISLLKKWLAQDGHYS